VRTEAGVVAGAIITVGSLTATSDANGRAQLTVPTGPARVVVTRAGFIEAVRDVAVEANRETLVTIDLTPQPEITEDVTVVASTRTGRRVDDQPTRVEILEREEIEEKLLMTPGDIVMMLNEMGGMRVQTTSPSLGAASVRIQGLRGRYTRFLSDGLPLFGGQPGGLGLLQIPPMDLGQVEVIKGAASALYGAGALGGVVNLISRRPGEDTERELLLNRSTRGATDLVGWLSTPLDERWGFTFLGGGHWQDRADVDADGWSDLAGYSRGVARPRLFWDDGQGRSFFATMGITKETRNGGTMPGRVLDATGLAHAEALDSTRVDAGIVAQTLVGGRFVLSARGAVAHQRHEHQFGDVRERDEHDTIFGEVTLRGGSNSRTWVVGAAIERDTYSPTDVPATAYEATTPGVFAQADVNLTPWLLASVSGRLDHHSRYGWFLSPRGALLARTGPWTARLVAGGGFVGPTALTEETEAAGLARLTVREPLQAERGRSVAFDLGRTDGPLAYSATFFASRVSHPARVLSETYTLVSLDEPATTSGVELLGTLRQAPFAVTASYTYVRAREQVGIVTEDVPLTPRHSAGLVAMLENEETGRLGLEVYVTGRQRLEANPYRDTSEPYVIVCLLAERRLGPVRLFINGENLTGIRQSRWDPLLRPDRAIDGRWTVDGWAPLEGRVVNGGIRWSF
jgi:iron complex outermembrane receptor protein